VQDAKVLRADYVEQFDAVLCDAPCSGLGVVNDNPDIKLNRDFNGIKSLVAEQENILKCVSKYVKIGGYLYYSTCSVMSCENQEIIKRFMSDIKGFEVCEITSKLQSENFFGTKQFLPDISGGLGFYVAKLKRVK
jgi:16S rRNA (cytosine967-C5)-methyltransferase